MSEDLAELYRHHKWANLQLLDFCSTLPDEQLDSAVEGTHGSIRATLLHIFAAEERYVSRLSDVPAEKPLRESEPFPGLEELRKRAAYSGGRLIEIASGFSMDRVLRGEWGGKPFTMRAIIPLMQAINHGTDHRSQISTILSQQGHTPPDLDVWAYNDTLPGL